jgi:spore coat polysaccharide biosynthesis predicted glycosyltransferase SpsG
MVDNVITAGGVSMYELIMLGFRPIVIVQNKYQQKVCNNLSEKGLIKKINNEKIDLKNLFLFLSTNKNFYEKNNNNINIKKISNGIKNIIRHIK